MMPIVRDLPGTYAGFTSLDRAYDVWLAGDAEGAARWAASVWTANGQELGAALLLCQLLVGLDRVEVAGPALEQLVVRYLVRGNLPAACVAAHLGAAAGGHCDGALRTLAQAFCRDSPGRSPIPMPPPPLPSQVQVEPTLAGLHGDRLWSTVEARLAALVEAERPALPAQLPSLPLFGELSEEVLFRLLGTLEVREVPAASPVIVEGDEGHDAFVVVRGLLNVLRGGAKLVLAALGPMAIFGEMALLGDVPRAASVVAVEPSQLLVIRREQLEGLARLEPAIGEQLARFCHGRMLDNLMRHSPFLVSLSAGERAALLGRFVTRAYGRGATLLREGEDNHRLIVIASGELEVRSCDRDGDHLSVARLGPGDVAGEISLVLRRPASADLVAAHNTVTLELSGEDFRAAIQTHPTLLRDLYALALEREEETRSLAAQQATDVSDAVLL